MMQIFAKTMDGKLVAIEIYKTEKIIDVKKKIQEKIGLAPDEQKLLFQGSILEDDKTVDEYGIVEKSVINVFRPKMEILAKTMDGKSVAIYVQRTERIIDVKKKIEEKIGLAPDEQRLVFQGGILDDDKTVGEYQITEKSGINVVVRLRGSMQIFAKTMDGKTVAFDIQKTERIIDVKKKIQEKIGLAPDEQKLVFQGSILEDDKTVAECGIVEKSVINVLFQPKMEILAKTMDGKSVAIYVQRTERIIDIKKKIEEKIKLAPYEPKLVFQGGILNDDKTVAEYGIEEKSVINVIKRLKGSMRIFAKTMDGKTVTFEILKTERIIDVKKKIQKKIGLAPEEQKLVFNGDPLIDDDKTAEEYQITEKSVIDVLPLGSIQIQVKSVDVKLDSICVMETDKIIDIKKKIQGMIKLAPDEQTLIYRGCVLEDERFLDEYGITDGSQIDICTKLRCEMKVFVKTSNSETIDIGVNKYEKVSSLRRKIESATRIASDKQILIHERTVLNTDDPNRTIEEFGLKDRSIIRVIHE